MRIRPYKKIDLEIIRTWITDEISHMKWSGNSIPFNFTAKLLEEKLVEAGEQGDESAFVATDNEGNLEGFFRMEIEHEKNAGFFRYIVVDGEKRGKGLGYQMLSLAVKYAFEVAGLKEVRLIVFDDNKAAIACYEKVGFLPEENVTLQPLEYMGKAWTKTRMIIKK